MYPVIDVWTVGWINKNGILRIIKLKNSLSKVCPWVDQVSDLSHAIPFLTDFLMIKESQRVYCPVGEKHVLNFDWLDYDCLGNVILHVLTLQLFIFFLLVTSRWRSDLICTALQLLLRTQYRHAPFNEIRFLERSRDCKHYFYIESRMCIVS